MQDRGKARRSRTVTRASVGAAAILGSMLLAVAAPALAQEAPEEVEAAAEPPADDEAAGPAADGASEAAADEPSEAAADEPSGAPADEATAEPAEDEATEEVGPEPPPEKEPATASAEDEGTAAEAEEDAPKPPRIDGTFVGGIAYGGLGLIRVNELDTDGPFATFGATATVGQMVFPWLGLGLQGGGGGGVRSQDGARQRLGQGFIGMQFTFVPAPERLPLSLRASFGFGGGAVRQAGIEARSGFGGAQFGGAVRYELFPFAKKRRPFRGGGFGLGPELGWLGFTPAARGRPMSNTIYLALATTFYFGS